MEERVTAAGAFSFHLNMQNITQQGLESQGAPLTSRAPLFQYLPELLREFWLVSGAGKQIQALVRPRQVVHDIPSPGTFTFFLHAL